MRTEIRIFLDENHRAINRGQSVTLLWTENHTRKDGSVVNGAAIWPCGGPAKDLQAFDHTAFNLLYFNVPITSLSGGQPK